MDTREAAGLYFSTMAARDWDAFAELLTPDVIYEMPQTGERITGREKYLQFNREYPGDWALTVTRLIVDGATAAGSMNFTVDSQQLVGLAFLEFRDGLVERITDFWPEPYEAPTERNHLVEQATPALDRLSI